MNSLSKTFGFAAVASLALAAPSMAQNRNSEPSYSTVQLNVGFLPDPQVVELQSGGSVDASQIGSPCTGYIANAPDVRLVYNAGTSPLIISATSKDDTTLVVGAPDGLWYCDDDTGEGVNPSVRFNKPLSGRYEIWVGTYGNSQYSPAQLHISELSSQ